MQYANEAGIPVIVFPRTKSGLGMSSAELLLELGPSVLSVDVVLLAGFLRLIPPELVRQHRRAILNIHPALLPAFGGRGMFGIKVRTVAHQVVAGIICEHRSSITPPAIRGHEACMATSCTSNATWDVWEPLVLHWVAILLKSHSIDHSIARTPSKQLASCCSVASL